MIRNKTYNRKKILIIFTVVTLVLALLAGRLIYLMVFCSEYYGRENAISRRQEVKLLMPLEQSLQPTAQSAPFL